MKYTIKSEVEGEEDCLIEGSLLEAIAFLESKMDESDWRIPDSELDAKAQKEGWAWLERLVESYVNDLMCIPMNYSEMSLEYKLRYLCASPTGCEWDVVKHD